MDEEFFERLYRGYAAEHLISSQLYRRGYEVFRLPADFGLDLVVTNQFKVARKQTAMSGNFPFALQVKSRWLRPADTVIGPSGRPETIVIFKLKNDELDLIYSIPNSGVALTAYVPVGAKGKYMVAFFLWLHSQQLKQIKDAGFLLSDGTNWNLNIRYRKMPRQTREELIRQIEAGCKLPDTAKRILVKELPPTFERQWKASDYMGFARKKIGGSNDLVFRAVWNVAVDFDGFPEWLPIGGLA